MILCQISAFNHLLLLRGLRTLSSLINKIKWKFLTLWRDCWESVPRIELNYALTKLPEFHCIILYYRCTCIIHTCGFFEVQKFQLSIQSEAFMLEMKCTSSDILVYVVCDKLMVVYDLRCHIVL